MASWISRVYLRWYRAFNTSTTEELDAGARPWERFEGKDFRFIEIPLSRRIATIVGANETGKSQLLSAMQKVVNGKAFNSSPYSEHNICRYCGLLSTQTTLWPELGLEFTFDSTVEFDAALKGLGISSGARAEPRLRVFINGGDTTNYVKIYDANGNELGSHSRELWDEKKVFLPEVRFVRSNLAFSNQIHVSQLIAQYDGKTQPAYEPVALHETGSSLVALSVDQVIAEASVSEGDPTPHTDNLRGIQDKIRQCKFDTGNGGLEVQLFQQILQIPLSVLTRIQSLRSSQNGYVEQLVEDINHRLSESLDISEYWQQDEDFTVSVEYKAGYFYFFITDRTGAKYTFDERSGGLKYFLSYYVQAKAIRDSMGKAGAVIVMDEPDGFLSAAGQRNLLSVFELLCQPDNEATVQRRCQIVYTTHSPFLINRNFPDRISLVRKGDGAEGTQLVELVSTRQYEPVRSGLGVESAETLFMGTENVILEEVSIQRVLVAAIQRFGDPMRIDDVLDLNRVTLVSASGVGDIPRLLQSTKRSKEKQPVTVVFVDGDLAGVEVKDEIVGEGFIHQDRVATISSAGLPTQGWCKSPQMLEDIVPPILLAHAICKLVYERWKAEQFSPAQLLEKWTADAETPADKRLVKLIREAGGGMARNVGSTELKAGAYVCLSTLLAGGNEEFEAEHEAINGLEAVVRQVCSVIRQMLSSARLGSRQDRLAKSIRLEVEKYQKLHSERATKADVRRILKRLEVLPVGTDEKTKVVRDNVYSLQQRLEEEVRHAGFLVKADLWNYRLKSLASSPTSVLSLADTLNRDDETQDS